jgi:hypothetical protein
MGVDIGAQGMLNRTFGGRRGTEVWAKAGGVKNPFKMSAHGRVVGL